MKFALCLLLVFLAAALAGAVLGLVLLGRNKRAGGRRDPYGFPFGDVPEAPRPRFDADAYVRAGVAEFEAQGAPRLAAPL